MNNCKISVIAKLYFMKQLVQVLLVLVIVTSAMVLPSCKKTVAIFTPIKKFSTPLQALINSDTSLSVFYAMVERANDTALYGGVDSVTVLIPTNAAFAGKGVTVTTVNAMTIAAADSFLRYHYIAAYDSVITPGSSTILYSKLGPGIYASVDSSGNYFNGISASRKSVLGSNASVFELSAPLQLQLMSATDLIASDTMLTYFAEALNHTSLSIVPASGWNTILAPVDSAFINAGYPTVASIDAADVPTLTNILQYHILPGQYFTSNFIGLSTVATLQGSSINITFNSGITQFTGTSDTTAAVITMPNRLAASNIIIHNINRVLTP
jgi:uncharacterized surface protein with fasciclin (FAS1) repeats